MKHALARYGTYKDSEVYWVEKIPYAWKILHLKNCVSTKITDGPHVTPVFLDDGVPFLSAEAVQDGGFNFDSKRGFISADDDNIYSVKCKPRRNDIFIVKSGSTTGKIGYVATDKNFNIWSPLALIRSGKNFHPRYIFHFLSSSFFQKQVQISWSFGTQPNIGMGVIEGLQVIVPPLPEQNTIAAYLDTKTAQIDRKIDLLTQKATQYGKLKQSLINETVTRGLDKSVAMKDSGVEWLGDVPKNWTVLRVKDTVIKIGNGVTPKGGSEVYTDVGIPFIRSQNVYDDGLHIGDVSFISDEIHRDMKGSQLKEGDILINITGASIGRTCVVPIELGIANINQHVAFLRTKCWFNTTYISLFLKSPFIKKYIQFEQNGASKEAFNLTQIANIPIVVPNVEEQTAIATYLDTKTTHIDRIIETINAQIEKLKELRKTLINDVVTGKIKVVE
jgi:type I restriction enzyme S subunit